MIDTSSSRTVRRSASSGAVSAAPRPTCAERGSPAKAGLPLDGTIRVSTPERRQISAGVENYVRWLSAGVSPGSDPAGSVHV
jgi:hypothetical protein